MANKAIFVEKVTIKTVFHYLIQTFIMYWKIFLLNPICMNITCQTRWHPNRFNLACEIVKPWKRFQQTLHLFQICIFSRQAFLVGSLTSESVAARMQMQKGTELISWNDNSLNSHFGASDLCKGGYDTISNFDFRICSWGHSNQWNVIWKDMWQLT